MSKLKHCGWWPSLVWKSTISSSASKFCQVWRKIPGNLANIRPTTTRATRVDCVGHVEAKKLAAVLIRWTNFSERTDCCEYMSTLTKHGWVLSPTGMAGTPCSVRQWKIALQNHNLWSCRSFFVKFEAKIRTGTWSNRRPKMAKYLGWRRRDRHCVTGARRQKFEALVLNRPFAHSTSESI